MERNKLKVFFRRVSSLGQDLAMQESADAFYRNKYLPGEILIIEERVSANKVRLNQRPVMLNLISMIKSNQVEIFYAFDRSRLFRDYYEASYFNKLCKKHNVQIFYTSSENGHPQSTGHILLEGVLNIVSDAEGKNIARRTSEARKRYPPKKTGYIKEKETKQYFKDPLKQSNLEDYFSALVQINNSVELWDLLNEFKKKLKVDIDRLLKIALDPFYAGYDLTNGEYNLSHVAPYISLAHYKELQSRQDLFSELQQREKNLIERNNQMPYCGICQRPMRFHYSIPLDDAWYSCSNKHPKIQVHTGELNSIINRSLEKVISHLDIEKLLRDSQDYFKSIRKFLEQELASIRDSKKTYFERVILEKTDLSNWREDPSYKHLNKLETKYVQHLSELKSKQLMLLENKQLSQQIEEYFKKSKDGNPFFLSSMLIQNLVVFSKEINIEVKKFDYVKNLDSSLIFKGDELH